MRRIKVGKSYVSGVGKIIFGIGTCASTETPFISIGDLDGSYRRVGEDLDESEAEKNPMTLIYFKNIEGLQVLENMIEEVKSMLIEQDKRRR